MLISMAADGIGDPADRRARFEATALPCMRALYNTAVRLTHGSDEASDLVQETYLRAFRGFDSFVPGTNCKAWLFKILHSVFINRFRKAQREPAGVSIDDLEKRYQAWVEAGGTAEASGAQAGFADSEVEQALRELPESFRSAVMLVDVEELSYEEAAAALDCPIGTLRSRLFRARKLLFAALLGYARRTGRLKTPAEDR
jgi:RNA polymerase sigma-70 factor (ECF subfamily)